jgi:hypothetical protein
MSQLQVTGEAKIRDIQGPVVANSGVITALDGAASQYVRGDGTLADFPTSTGGGSSVSYYLNSSVSQGTIGGVAYRELSKEPIIGSGTDIAISSNGYVASYLTDANDPDVVLIPGGNFNCEFYFSVNNNTGNPFFYAELYKYDGTTFTLLGSSVGVPEYITQGTTIAPYYFAIPVATATLALTDRLAIRIYVNVGGRTVTLHTENGHLCQVVTTLSKGMVSLNNLTDQSQFLTTGTSGTNFAIVSSGDTHTFNLPIASATNTGKLSSTDWSTFNNKVPYTGATANVDLGTNYITSATIVFWKGTGSGLGNIGIGRIVPLGQNTTGQVNIGIGENSLFYNTTGSNNIALGGSANGSNTTGSSNIGIGSSTNYANTTSSNNIAIGLGALRNNTIDNNIAIGHLSSYFNTTGNQNVALGYTTLYTNTTGSLNTAIGHSTLYSNTTGSQNTAIGGGALFFNTTGSNNTGIGNLALQQNTTGVNNTAIGSFSHYSNTTGQNNTAIGSTSLAFNTTGYQNTAIGSASLNANTTAFNNTAIGNAALNSNTTGTNNTALGNNAGSAITTGSNNTIIGTYIGTAAMSNNIVLADGAGNIRYQWDGTNNVFGNPISGTTATFTNSGTGIGVGITNSGNGDGIKITHSLGRAFNIQSSGSGFGIIINNETASTSIPFTIQKQGGSVVSITDAGELTLANSARALSFVKSGGTSSQYLMADGSTSTLTNPVTGTGTTNYLPKFTGASTIGNSVIQESNSNIGIGGTASNYGAGFTVLEINNTTSGVLNISRNSTVQGQLSLGTNTFKIDTVGASTSLLFGINNAERMRLDTLGNLGLGTASPLAKFSVKLATATAVSTIANTTGWDSTYVVFGNPDSTSGQGFGISVNNTLSGVNLVSVNPTADWIDTNYYSRNHIFYGGGVQRMYLNSSGNLGLGVTPSAWYSSEGYKALQVGNASLFGRNSTNSELYLSSNTFENSSGNPTYITSDFATRYAQNDGVHSWLTAPSGTAGNAITFTQAMTLNASGNLGIGTTSPTYKLDVYGGASGTRTDVFVSNAAANYNIGVLSDNNGFASSTNAMLFYTAATERMRITSAGNTQPGTDNAYSLGVSGTRWSAVWAANGTIQTSDEREKKDIIDADLGLDFISKLRPVSFKWKVGQNIVTSEVVKDEEGNPILDEEGNEKTESVIVPREGKRTHYGLIAQEVEELLDGKDFGGFIHDEETDTKGLRYDQFIPLLIKSIQELEARIKQLENK